jgi:hypothetical protein
MNIFVMLLPILGSILVCWIAALMVISEADRKRPALETGSGRIEFLPNRRSYWGVYLIIAVLSYPVVSGVLSQITSGTGAWLVLVCMGFIMLLLISFPGSIEVTSEGLAQNYWIGRRKRIAWQDVAGFEFNNKRKTVTVRSKSGPKIVHTRQLADRERFIAEVETRCPGELPVAVAKEPSVAPLGKLENS